MFENFECRENESMKNHTTLHIGGNARWFLLPKNENEIAGIIDECKRNFIDFFVLGNGSNLLVSDEGFDGAVISTEKLSTIAIKEGSKLEVFAGVNLFALNKFCADNNLTGLEWSYGIPGTIGGACKMNAGAFGEEFCSKVEKIIVLKNGKIYTRKKLHYAYRKGCLRNGEILISAIITLKKEKKEEIIAKQKSFFEIRKEKQPYDFHSLGSVFKRGKNFVPAKLIDEYGLKGTRKGDVCISMKHAGFVINKKNGRAKDFLDIVKLIENIAKKDGYKFQREFVMLGFDK